MILIIDRRDTVLRYARGALQLEVPEQKPRRIPVNQLEQLVVHGNPLIEASVWRALSAAGVAAVMLPHRGQPHSAVLGSGLAVQLPLRRLQHRCADDDKAALILARWFIDSKLRSLDLPLVTLCESYQLSTDRCQALKSLRDASREKLRVATDIAEIMGIEGQMARVWFELLAARLPDSLNFSGRNRRPPRDPVNALLSLGYTLMGSEVRQCLISAGFDSSLGFLHQEYPGREALVLDFTEVFRSGVDNFVLQWLSEMSLDRESFYYREEEGCRMGKALRPEFYGAWAEYCESWPRPLADADSAADWPVATLREQVNGQIAQLRDVMKALKAAEGLEVDDG